MALDLEIAGVVRDLSAEEAAVPVPAKPRELTRLRDSHHMVARLFAHGMRPQHISTMTGYALSRLSILQNDPAFIELVEFYRADGREVALDTEAWLHGIGRDFWQSLHEKHQDDPESLDPELRFQMGKAALDRAGFAPVTRTINKNLNMNIAARLDAKTRKDEAA